MLDDLFEIFGNHHKRCYGHCNDHGHDEHYHGNYNNGYGNNPEYRNPEYKHQHNQDILDPKMMLIKVLQNKQLIIVLAVAAVVFLISIVAVLYMFMPVIYKILAMLEKNGIKGVVEYLNPILNRIWEGKEALSRK